ncbi:MAG TPA: hypothetical protein VFV95_09170 [Vicinamibacterales bacterium]|nr:hypothetical protein [Vicinamibacterales bacterium]
MQPTSTANAADQPADPSAGRPRKSVEDRDRIRIFVAPYKTADRSTTVVLVVDADATLLGLGESTGRYSGRLAVTWTATDGRGRSRSGDAFNGTVTLDADAGVVARRHGVRTVSELDLPPGQYQLRVNVRGPARSGNILTTLEVPDFEAPLTMGGVALSTASEQTHIVSTVERPRVKLPAVPTPRREFEAGETLTVFTEVYESRLRLERSPSRGTSADPGDAGDHTTNLSVELRADDGSILQTVAAERTSDRRRAGTHMFVARLPLSDVPSGRYVVRVKARANIGEPDTALREIPIRVGPRGSLGRARQHHTRATGYI